jgi:integrase/recombinase XerD
LHPESVPIGMEILAIPGTCEPAAQSDETLIRLWLDGRSAHTRRAYQGDARLLLATAGKAIAALTLIDLQAWMGSLGELAPASRARKIGAIKSLLSFGERTGYLPFNVGAAIRVPPIKNVLAERILEEDDVIRLIALEPDRRKPRVAAARPHRGAEELAGLRWRDAKRRAAGGGQITVFGKGGKTRIIVLPASIWRELIELRGEAPDDDPAFRSAKGGALDPSQVHRIVKAAAARAGLPRAVSAHYLRHAHVSHALDRGAPAHLVQATVGHSDLRTTSRYAHARPNESSSTYLRG